MYLKIYKYIYEINPHNYGKPRTRITKRIFAAWSLKKYGSVESQFCLKRLIFHNSKIFWWTVVFEWRFFDNQNYFQLNYLETTWLICLKLPTQFLYKSSMTTLYLWKYVPDVALKHKVRIVNVLHIAGKISEA